MMEETQVRPAEAAAPAAPAKEPPKFQAPKKKRKWVKRLVIVLVIAAILVFLLSRCMGAGQQVLSSVYLPYTVQRQDMTVSVSGAGAIEPIHAYRVTSLVSGEILEAPFEEGQTVRPGAVAALSVDGGLHAGGSRHPGLRLHAELAALQVIVDVDGPHRVHAPLLFQKAQNAVGADSASGLLPLLKAEEDRAVQVLLLLRENLGRCQEHGAVGVMAAGMAGLVRRLRHADAGARQVVGVLRHRQGVQIRPQGDLLAGPSRVQHADHRVGGRAVGGKPHALQLLLHKGGGAHLLVAHLRDAVDLPAAGDGVRLVGGRFLLKPFL